MPNEHDVVALKVERKAEDLHVGAVGAIVHCHADGATFEVEFLDEHGRTKRIATVPAGELRRLNLMPLAPCCRPV